MFRPLPLLHRTAPAAIPAAVAACLFAMLPILAFGLWRSGMLDQELWSPILANQAAWIIAFAAPAAALALYAAPIPLRGWPALSAVAILATAATTGVAATLSAALLTLCCLVTGQALFRIAPSNAQPGPTLAAAAGLAVLMLLLVAASLAHLPMLPVCLLIPATALGALALSPQLRATLRQSLTPPETPPAQPWPLARAITAWLILALLIFYAANAALPERFYDPLTMHLMIPTQELTFGHWSYDPASFALADFPLAADHIFTLALALGGEPTAKLVNMLALAGILLLLHDIVRPLAGPRLAETTLLLLLSLSIALLSSTTTMVENLLALQIIAATRAILLLTTTPQISLLALSVILPAIAATKLQGVVAALPCAAIALLLTSFRTLPRRTWLPLASTALIAAILGAGQYAYAWLRTGNPVFPLMNHIFRSPAWPPTRFDDLRWQGHLSWRLLYRMTFNSQGYLESDNGAMGFALLLLLLPGMLATLLVPRRAPVVALLIAATYTVAITLNMQYIRYLWPVFPLLLIVCAHGLATLERLPAGHLLGAAAAALATILGLLTLPSAGWVLKTADLRAAVDPAARHAMLANQASTRLAVDIVNAMGPTKPRVLFGGEPYGAFLRGTAIYAAWYNRTLNADLYQAATPEAVAAILDRQHADYVIAMPKPADPIEAKVASYADTHGTRIPLPGYAALWRLTTP